MTDVQELPTLTGAEAVKQKARLFNSVKPCKECGSHSRWIAGSFSHSNIACYVCEPMVGHLTTLNNIRSAEMKHNKSAWKTWKSNWSVPVVFGGMSTK